MFEPFYITDTDIRPELSFTSVGMTRDQGVIRVVVLVVVVAVVIFF